MLRGFHGTRRYSADTGQPSGGEQTATEPVKTEKTFTQAELEAIVKDRLERAQRKAGEAEAKARAEAEAKALAEQGEFKTLAEQRAAEVARLGTELESAKATGKALERYQEAVKAMIAPQLAGLPEQLQARIKNLDPIDQLEWLAALGAMKPSGDSVGSPAPGKKPATGLTPDIRSRVTI